MKNNAVLAINKYNMIGEDDIVVVGVSGGADSMALLHFLMSINVKVIVVHINHNLRGNESDRDEEFVINYCKNNNIEFYNFKVNVKEESIKNGMSVEDYGRKVRYDYFYRISKKYNAKIATAHTLSDSIETTIFNIIRGTGIKGLAGIPAVRENIIRPLIFVTRNMVEEYCNDNDIEYIIDSSNFSHDYTRNKIRLDIIPKIREINPSFEKSFFRLKEQSEEESDYLNIISDKYLKRSQVGDKYDLKIISRLHRVIKTRLIINAVYNKFKVNLQKSHVDLICDIIDNGFGTVTIPGKIYVNVDNGYLRMFKEKNKTINWESKFKIGKILTEPGRMFIIKVVDKDEYVNLKEIDKKLFYKSLDYDKISLSAIFRNRRPGDQFSLVNRKITKSLKKLFNEKKVPVEKRNNLAIIEDRNKILWIEDFGPSDDAKITENTRKVIIIY